LSRVSRFKICLYELGDGPLTPDEQNRIRKALQAEADRLRSIPTQIDVGELSFVSPNQAPATDSGDSHD
jgi:hypothetical protein